MAIAGRSGFGRHKGEDYFSSTGVWRRQQRGLLSHHAIALVVYSPSKLAQIGGGLGKNCDYGVRYAYSPQRTERGSAASKEKMNRRKERKKEQSEDLRQRRQGDAPMAVIRGSART